MDLQPEISSIEYNKENLSTLWARNIFKNGAMKSIQKIIGDLTTDDLRCLVDTDDLEGLGETDSQKALLFIVGKRLKRYDERLSMLDNILLGRDIYTENPAKKYGHVYKQKRLISSCFKTGGNETKKIIDYDKMYLSEFIDESIRVFPAGQMYDIVDFSDNLLLDDDLPYICSYVKHFKVKVLLLSGNNFRCIKDETSSQLWQIIDFVLEKVSILSTPVSCHSPLFRGFINDKTRLQKLIWILPSQLDSCKWKVVLPSEKNTGDLVDIIIKVHCDFYKFLYPCIKLNCFF